MTMIHFEALDKVFEITVLALIRNDIDRLTMPSVEAKGQKIINSQEALKNRIDIIGRKEWELVHSKGRD